MGDGLFREMRQAAFRDVGTSLIVTAWAVGGNISNSELDGDFYRGQSGQAPQTVLAPRVVG